MSVDTKDYPKLVKVQEGRATNGGDLHRAAEGGRMKTIITRDDIISDKGDVETLELDLRDGKITDRQAIVILARAWLRLSEFIIRKTWGL